MKRPSRRLISKLTGKQDSFHDPQVRMRVGVLEGVVSIVINTVLFAVKLFFGLQVQSSALIADAIHTLGDSATSLIVIIGSVMAGKPSDPEHPFGHGQIEQIATLIIAVLLFVAGFELLHQSVGRVAAPSVTAAGIPVIAIIFGTLVIKEILARFSYILGDIIDSETLKADALHHRTDVLATALVVISLIASRYGYTYVDGIMGILVSLVIVYSAYEIAKDAVNPLIGAAPPQEVLQKIESLALSVTGVKGVHDIIFHQYGRTVVISLHIEVPEDLSATVLHDISEKVEEKIERKFKGVVVVHIDPINKNHPRYPDVSRVLDDIIRRDERIESFHDLRIIGDSPDSCNVVVEIALSDHTDTTETLSIRSAVEDRFRQTFPDMKIVIKVDPVFAYNV